MATVATVAAAATVVAAVAAVARAPGDQPSSNSACGLPSAGGFLRAHPPTSPVSFVLIPFRGPATLRGMPSRAPAGPRLARHDLWILFVTLLAVVGCSSTPRHASSPLAKALTFHASFDRGTDADFALGDPWLYHAPALDKTAEARPGLPGGDATTLQPGTGRHGGALHFARPTPAVVFFRAGGNLPWSASDWSGSVSFWLRTDLARLAPGFCDPVNITPKAWDDAAFFIEFEKRTNDIPFRLGAYADKRVWNPLNRNWNDIPASGKPLVTIPGPPFSGDRWTHIVFTWERFNTGASNGVALLYLDGAQVGAIRGRTQTFTWDPASTRIHLGLSYIGQMDDLAVFNRALTMPEIQHVRSLPRGVRSLYSRSNPVP
jgi:hypothetical protein